MLDIGLDTRVGVVELWGTDVDNEPVPCADVVVDVGNKLLEWILEVTKENELGVDLGDVGLTMVIKVLERVVVNPLKAVFEIELRWLNVVGAMDGDTPTVVVEVIVNVVVCPFGIVLVIVNKAVEITEGGKLFPGKMAVIVIVVWLPKMVLVDVGITLENVDSRVLDDAPGGSRNGGAGTGDGGKPLLLG
jgi:hypothetical protein